MSVIVQRLGITPSAMLVDIGNTRVGMASWYDKRLHPSRQLSLDELEAQPAWLTQAWQDLPLESDRHVLVSSVSPPSLNRFAKLLDQHCAEAEILLIGRDVDLPIKAAVPEPDKVGTDRICAAAAAWQQVKGACVVASFGTALTIDLVSDDGMFMGGAILPGMATSARALHEHTAQLPQIQIEVPQEAWGTGTVEAIKIGIYCGLAGAVREITERYATQIGKWPPLLLTGGDAELFAGALDFASAVIPNLCLRGLALTMEKAVLDANRS